MAGLVPAISIHLARLCGPKRDRWDKPGDDALPPHPPAAHLRVKHRAAWPVLQFVPIDAAAVEQRPRMDDDAARARSRRRRQAPLRDWRGLLRARVERSADKQCGESQLDRNLKLGHRASLPFSAHSHPSWNPETGSPLSRGRAVKPNLHYI